jgi:hypothetical protein
MQKRQMSTNDRSALIVLQNPFLVTEDKFFERRVWRSNNYLEGYVTKGGAYRRPR